MLCGLTVLLIVWGAVVRSTQSGLGCPDWPLCYGSLIPPLEKAALIEYFHRLLATLVGLMALGVMIAVWCKKELRRQMGQWALMMVFLLLAQAVLGGVTVKSELQPHIVATHLGMALIFLAVIFYMALSVCEARGASSEVTKIPGPSLRTSRFARFIAQIALAFLFLQMILGGMVAASNAGLACPDFPTCQGVWWPKLQGLAGIHFLHRLGALAVSVLVLILTLVKFRLPAVRAVFVLTLLQVLFGIGAVMMGLPLAMRIAHNAVAVLLFLGLMKTTYALRHNPA